MIDYILETPSEMKPSEAKASYSEMIDYIWETPELIGSFWSLPSEATASN